MSTVQPTAEGRAPVCPPATLSRSQKPQRVLACVLCQQRKVKCDRKSPCANCIKSKAQCVPATKSSRRRRRFPERELLERLYKYEDLLRQNNIKFEPLHRDSVGEKELESPCMDGHHSEEHLKARKPDFSSPLTTGSSERVYEPKNIWVAINQEFRDREDHDDSSDDDLREVVFKKAWDQMFANNDHLLFGSRATVVDISTLHPDPVQIFRLWQLYLENVNPLLKVTHIPSLQGRIIEAASNVLSINPNLEALMFSIYCMAILSLATDSCQAIFGSAKVDLLARYQFGCQQALLNCGFLRSSDRDCLTALYLYLVSVRPSIVPQSLFSMLGVAIRIAQRMGIHSESALAKCAPIEAEMRRRLWWSLVLFDSRMGEMADFKTTTLTPTWDCRVPLNVNDSDFRLDMKEPPQVQGKSTEALFAAVRSELGDFTRNSAFHLGFTSPALKPMARNGAIAEGSELASLEKMVENKYLQFCDPENPLHFMTIWTTRSYLAKCRLMEHYFRNSTSSAYQAEAQYDDTISYALTMLECDTKLMTSPHTEGFRWMIYSYFPFPAFIRIAQILKRQPVGGQAEQAWEMLSENYNARFGLAQIDITPFFKILSKIVLHAWAAREAALKESQELLVAPSIVVSVKQNLARMAPNEGPGIGQSIDAMDMGTGDFPMPVPMGFDDPSPFYSMGWQGDGVIGSGLSVDMPGAAPVDADISQLDWSAMDWNLVTAPVGETGEMADLRPQY